MEVAAAKIGIMPWDFWRLTPAEFKQQMEAYQWRDEQAWVKQAWQTAHIMNIWLKEDDRVTVGELMDTLKPREPQSAEEQVQVAELYLQALGGEDRREVH